MTTSRTKKKALLGSVTFVGAGPGDPGLLPVRAVPLLAEADVVVLDRVAREGFLQHCREDVEVLDGAAGAAEVGEVGLTGAALAKLLVKNAKDGRKVVRLLDGDAAGLPASRNSWVKLSDCNDWPVPLK